MVCHLDDTQLFNTFCSRSFLSRITGKLSVFTFITHSFKASDTKRVERVRNQQTWAGGGSRVNST